jgi:nucleotide-binding universal stress UspA family protein
MGVIVVGFDGSENATSALRWAANEAHVTGDDLRVVSVWEFPYMEIVPPTFGVTLPPYHEMQKAAEKKLDDAIQGAALPAGLRIEQTVLEGEPAQLLLEQAKDADLLVVGARGRGGFLGLLTGSVATKAVNHAGVPVAVIRA